MVVRGESSEALLGRYEGNRGKESIQRATQFVGDGPKPDAFKSTIGGGMDLSELNELNKIEMTHSCSKQEPQQSNSWAETANSLGMSVSEVKGVITEIDKILASRIAKMGKDKADATSTRKRSARGSQITVHIPIDKQLLRYTGSELGRQLSIRIFAQVLPRFGYKKSWGGYRHMLEKVRWKHRWTYERLRKHVAKAARRGSLSYRVNNIELYLKRWEAHLERHTQKIARVRSELGKSNYAGNAILSFYIAHLNGVISTANMITSMLPGGDKLQIHKVGYVGEWGCKNANVLDLAGALGVGGLAAGGVLKLLGKFKPLIAGLTMGGVKVGPALLGLLQVGGVAGMTYLGAKEARDQIMMLATGDVEERVKKGDVYVTITRAATKEEMEMAALSIIGGMAGGAVTKGVLGRKGLGRTSSGSGARPRTGRKRGKGRGRGRSDAKVDDKNLIRLEKELGVPIVVNEQIGNLVRVQYTHNPKTWKVTTSHIEIGPHATVSHVRAHKRVMKRMRRYNGVIGKLRRTWDRMGKRDNPFEPKTNEWSAWHEVRKLDDIVAASRKRLASAGLADKLIERETRRLRRARAKYAKIERQGRAAVKSKSKSKRRLAAPNSGSGVAPSKAGGTRGTYEPHDPKTDPGPRPVYIERPGKGKSSQGNLADEIRKVFLKGPAKVTLAEAAHVRPRSGEGQYELVIPATATQVEIVVPVTVKSIGTPGKSLHQKMTGPARLVARSPKEGKYTAKIEVHRDLATGDIRYALGHELNELVHIARSGARGTAITAQKRASLMRARPATGKKGTPKTTAHDRAAAQEFKDFTVAKAPEGRRSRDYELPKDLISRAKDMGFHETKFLDEKIQLLRKVGVDEDMLGRLRTMAVHTEVKAALPPGSTVATTRVVGHLLHGSGGTRASPISGLHLDTSLQSYRADLVANNKSAHLLPAQNSTRAAGGVTYNAYEQWKWTGSGTPSPASRPTTAGGTAGAIDNGWVLAREPKTTFSDMTAFLAQADMAWTKWQADNTPTPGTNVPWNQPMPGGISIGGFVDVLAANTFTHISVFPFRIGGLANW